MSDLWVSQQVAEWRVVRGPASGTSTALELPGGEHARSGRRGLQGGPGWVCRDPTAGDCPEAEAQAQTREASPTVLSSGELATLFHWQTSSFASVYS